jgi:methylenetetrahydrofolate dehydrogenase (NADP+)/methenyltetrahydrofolate cyclohydrolase
MARIISGTEIGRQIRAEVAEGVEALRAEGTVPGLSVVLIGDDPASEVYVRSKTRACEEAGMNGRTLHLSPEIDQAELLGVIDGLNADPDVHGILVQLPIPRRCWNECIRTRTWTASTP